MKRATSQSGFSLIELLVATGLLLVVSSIVTNALMQMTHAQKTIWNRTEMHSGIRGATELLQQEVGQAGRVTLPSNTITLTTNVVVAAGAIPCTPTALAPFWTGGWTGPVTVSSVAGLFADIQYGIKLVVLDATPETITVQAIAGNTITACFSKSHTQPVTMMALGGFAEGVIPPSTTYSMTTGGVTQTGIYVNGSDKNHLKLFGDINGDGNLVYIEYVCDNGSIAGVANPSHNLYRNVMAFNAAPPKPNVTNSQILLSNVWPNPNDASGDERPCFKYQWTPLAFPVGAVLPATLQYVTDVAITLTVQTQQTDTMTRQFQTETKALLNVSPRNVFDVLTMYGYGEVNRVQYTPASVTALLPNGTP